MKISTLLVIALLTITNVWLGCLLRETSITTTNYMIEAQALLADDAKLKAADKELKDANERLYNACFKNLTQ